VRWTVLLLLVLACQRPADEEHGTASPAPAVPGMETVLVKVEPVRDVVNAFGQVAAEAEPPEVRDARTQVTEAEARLRLAEQQVRRLAALGQAVAPRKELEAARAEQAGAGAAAARARATLAAFGELGERTPLAAGETWVIAHVVQSDVGRVEAASPCRFSADAFPGRRFTGEEKSRRQVLFSTDLVYDVLRKHQADHVLLRAARADAAAGLLDLKRLGDMLSRIQGRITHRELDHVSPLAVPLMLEIGRESVYGEAADELLAEAAEELVKEATG